MSSNNNSKKPLGPPDPIDTAAISSKDTRRQETKPNNFDSDSAESHFFPERLILARQISKDIPVDVPPQSVLPLPVNVIMVGTGEYTTGYVHGKASDSDKSAGVVALTMFDLRRRGMVNDLALVGVSGSKFPGIRKHIQMAIGNAYEGLNTHVTTYPADEQTDPKAYLQAINAASPGDAMTIFTPDDTHFEIALAAIEKGIHVLVTKPAVKTLEHHRILHEAAMRRNVIVSVEVHKRWDPIYADARDRIQGLGPFSYMYAYMSQPKHQLETFRAWAGKSSDISYYLNSHHIDFHEWCVGHSSRPISVTATASTGVATSAYDIDSEDTITLTVQWENLEDTRFLFTEDTGAEGGDAQATKRARGLGLGLGTAVYTSSWVAPKSDVHSQQRFFYMGQKGEVNVDQAHRGYSMAADEGGYRSVNPLFMKYTPTNGRFSGQLGYGYRSFEAFIEAVQRVNSGAATADDYEEELASIASTYRTTAILEAGRRSLDEKRTIEIVYEDSNNPCRPTALR
jgi:D-galacturonate reductase